MRGDLLSGVELSEWLLWLIFRVKFKEKWMKGDGFGEYGGLFIDLKIWLFWGGGVKEDFLMFIGDYIWKKIW